MSKCRPASLMTGHTGCTRGPPSRPDGSQERQADADLIELAAAGLGEGGLLRSNSVQVIIWDATPAIADIQMSVIRPSLASCAPTGCSPWSCCSRPGAGQPRGHSPPNWGSVVRTVYRDLGALAPQGSGHRRIRARRRVQADGRLPVPASRACGPRRPRPCSSWACPPPCASSALGRRPGRGAPADPGHYRFGEAWAGPARPTRWSILDMPRWFGGPAGGGRPACGNWPRPCGWAAKLALEYRSRRGR